MLRLEEGGLMRAIQRVSQLPVFHEEGPARVSYESPYPSSEIRKVCKALINEIFLWKRKENNLAQYHTWDGIVAFCKGFL